MVKFIKRDCLHKEADFALEVRGTVRGVVQCTTELVGLCTQVPSFQDSSLRTVFARI